MIRCLYRALLSLHPPAFQEQFGEEMLWIFDETRAGGAMELLSDGFLSLLRQWFVGYEVWKVAPLVVYWLVQLTLIVGILTQRGFR
jgi:hypothetical protein